MVPVTEIAKGYSNGRSDSGNNSDSEKRTNSNSEKGKVIGKAKSDSERKKVIVKGSRERR